MIRVGRFMLTVICSSAVLATGPLGLAQSRSGSIKMPTAPSANQGRQGTYEVKTANPNYSYHVYVPNIYSAREPAGLHLFFHGMSDQGSATNFGRWAEPLLERYNLIGVSMKFMDMQMRSPYGDQEGKLAVARMALAQVMLDYKVIPGKGVIAGFSGGGNLLALMITQDGNQKRGAKWPFCHASLYSTNYWGDPTGAIPMSWTVSCGEAEWNFLGVPLGSGQSQAYGALLQASRKKGASADVVFKVIKGKGHDVAGAEVALAAEQFRRSNLAFAPFIYAPDYSDRQLAAVVALANSLKLGSAHKSLKLILANPLADPTQRAAAEILQRRLDSRVEAIVKLVGELAATDLFLLGHYGPGFLRQLESHPRKQEVQALIAAGQRRPGYATAAAAHKQFVAGFPYVDERSGKLQADKILALKQILLLAGEKSMVGKMAAELLLLP